MRDKTIAALAFSIAVGLGGAAYAATFAEYDASSSLANLSWTQTAPDAGTLTTTGDGASAQTVFSFLKPGTATLKELPALFTLTASSTSAATSAAGFLIEPDVSGTFSFTYDGPANSKIATGADLLSGTFTGASISGPAGGSTGSVQDAIISGGTVSFTSAFVKFAPTGDKALSLSMTSVLPGFSAAAGGAPSSFTGVSTGSFASDIRSGGGAGGVPEPATWAMMLVGFAGIGLVARRRRPASLATT